MNTFLYIFYVVINLILISCIFYFIGKILLVMLSLFPTYRGDCPYVPTKTWVIKKTFKLLNIKKGDKVLDIGSGDGKFLLYGAKRVEADFVGIEINHLLVFLSRLKKYFMRLKGSVKIIDGDFKKHSFSDYDKVFLFSMPSLIKKLMPKLEKEIDKGTYVASIKFPVKSDAFKEIESDKSNGEYDLFLYKKVK